MDEGVGEAHLRIMAFVFGLIMAANSSILGIQPFSSSIFHKPTSTPLNSGNLYSCPKVGYWQMMWSPGPQIASRIRKLAMIEPGVTRTLSAVSFVSADE